MDFKEIMSSEKKNFRKRLFDLIYVLMVKCYNRDGEQMSGGQT